MRILLAALTTFVMVLVTQVGAAHAMNASQCTMTSEGLFNGAWVKHRIVSGEDVLFGANEMEIIFSQLESLRVQGLCR